MEATNNSTRPKYICTKRDRKFGHVLYEKEMHNDVRMNETKNGCPENCCDSGHAYAYAEASTTERMRKSLRTRVKVRFTSHM